VSQQVPDRDIAKNLFKSQNTKTAKTQKLKKKKIQLLILCEFEIFIHPELVMTPGISVI